MRFFAIVFTVTVLARVSLPAADQTWTGAISDSACGAHHEETAEGAGRIPDPDCTRACVRGGSKYVLVVEGKVFQIANQDHKGVVAHAGQNVKVSGDLKDKTITVATVAAVIEE